MHPLRTAIVNGSMTGTSLNTAFGSTSAASSSGSVNSVAESSGAGSFGDICQAILSQQSSNSVLTSSSSSNAGVSSSADLPKISEAQPPVKQKDPELSESLLSLGAMLAMPGVIVLDQLAPPDASALDGVPPTQLNFQNTPDIQREQSTLSSGSIENGPDAPILSSLFVNASSSSFSSALNDWSAPPPGPETGTPPEPLSKDDRCLSDIHAPSDQDLLGMGSPDIQDADAIAIVSEKPPAVGQPAILATDVVAAPRLAFDGLPESDLPLTAVPVLPRQSTDVQSAEPESRIHVESDSAKGPADFQRATRDDKRTRVSSSDLPEVLQTSTHQDDAHCHLFGGLQKVTNAASSVSFGVDFQTAPTGHPSHFQQSTDSQTSLSAPSMIQAAIQTLSSNSPDGSEPAPEDESTQGPSPAGERDQAASQSSLATASATDSSLSFESVNKNWRTDAASNPRRNGQPMDVASSVPSLAPPSNPVSHVDPTGSGTVTTNGNSKSPSPEKSGADDGASYRHSDLPLSPASSAGPVQLAQILNKVTHAEMRIGLNTAAFGDVEIRTVVHATDVGVQIGSEKGNLQALLTNDLPSISGHLQQQNLHLTQVSFQSPGFGSHGGSSQQQDSSYRRPLVVQPHSEHSLNPESTRDEVSETPRIRSLSGLSVLA